MSRRLPRSPRTVRWRLGLLSFVMSCLILAISGIALVALHFQRGEADRSTLVVEPAFDANRQVGVTMVEAQSALRGYIVYRRAGGEQASDSETHEVLATYTAAEQRIDAELGALAGLISSQGFGRDETRRATAYAQEQQQRQAITAWWQYARAVRSSGAVDRAELARGLQLFVAVEQANGALSGTISQERSSLRTSLREAIVWASLAVVGATVVALALAVAMGWRTTSALTKPLQRLRDIVRRQRHGDRTAWAATDIGAVEVRELAGDVNALTAAHHELTDRQNASLDILRARSVLSRAVQGSDDLGSALRRAADGIGESLGVDRVVCGVFNERRKFDDAVVWTAPDAQAGLDNPWELRQEIAEQAERIWEGERHLVVDDVSALPVGADGDDWWADLRGPLGTGALLVVPFGLGDVAIGVASIRTAQARAWTDNEVAFVHHIVGEITRLVVKATSERQQAEHVARLEELDRQKDDFMSTVSHELRTPLTSISGYLEMLDDGDAGELTNAQRKMLDIVGRNTQRLRGLIEDLLVLNQLEATGLPPETPVVSVCEIVRDVAEELVPVAARAGVSIVHTERDGSWVRADQVQLSRAVSNLASNAVKFTPTGGSVTLSCRPSIDGRHVEIRCTDTGMGIPAEETKHIFTRFFRASNASKAQIQGTGLGLVIVREIVERHGGTMEVASAEGQGATFTMVIPVADEEGTCSVHGTGEVRQVYSPFRTTRGATSGGGA